jgi:phosphoglycerol transferase MdoB-like AlkP superfamily enzyme
MLVRLKIPKTILWVINLFLIFLLLFTLFRVAIYVAFCPDELSFTDLLPSFLLGIRYDLRWIALLLMPIVVVSLLPRLSPFYCMQNRKWWTWYLAVITLLIFFFFAADFGNFSYNKTRLDAGALNFYEDWTISWQMMHESYPIFWILTGLLVVVLFFRWMYRRSHKSVVTKTDGLGIPYRRNWFVGTALVFAFFVYGRMSWPPLKWDQVFILKDNFKSFLALNPMQKFFATVKYRDVQPDEKKTRALYPVMAEWMQWPQKDSFLFTRAVTPDTTASVQPNIVLVQCESFSMYKSSMSGNPLNTTPYFNELCKKGIFFERCFTPHFSTARGLFTMITGVPDAQLYKFSSRNPAALDQRTIINSWTSYKKMYFLGGSAEFNNFEGILKNINGLEMYTEGKYAFKAPKVNVWGISDKDLFLEANAVFNKQNGPFFAYIQTADNHRPFMVPPGDSDFVKLTVPEEQLEKYGFESLDEYNSFRYSDYCIKKFIEAASSQSWFNNTIFVFIGDHGVAGNAKALYPSTWTTQRLTDNHVPLLFYAPSLIRPEWRKETVSQTDVMPTIAGLLQQPYTHSGLGRDLLDPGKKNNFAFVMFQDVTIGIVTDSFYYTRNINFPEDKLHPVLGEKLNIPEDRQLLLKKQMNELASGMYETSKWLLLHNKKDQ